MTNAPTMNATEILRAAGLDRIMICHHAPLTERKRTLSAQLDRLGIEVDWMERYLPDEIRNDYEKLTADWAVFEKMHITQPYQSYENAGKKLTMSELSLYLKHLACLRAQVENNWRNLLILEDDITIYDKIVAFLKSNMDEFTNPAEFGFPPDMLMLGTAFNFRAKRIRRGKFIHFEPDQRTRCAHAIIYNLGCVPKILERAVHINMPWDFKLNEIIQVENLKVAWSEPGIPQSTAYQSSVLKA